MITYLKYLEDNLNNIYLKEFDEYRKYLKIFYSENSKCPVDSKTLLLKKETATEYEMWCKSKTSKDWKIIIKKPKVYNLNIKLNELNTIYKNRLLLFKQKLRQNLESPVYIPEKDNEMETELKELKKYENEIESIKELFEKQEENKRDLYSKRQEQLKKLLEIKIKKKNVFRLCQQVDGEVRKQLIEIAKNEKKVDQERIKQIAKTTQITQSNIKNWVDYYKLNMEYVSGMIELGKLNDEIFQLNEKYDHINSNYVIEPPEILSDKKVKMEEVIEKSESKEDEEETTETKKRIRMKK
jgi:hypothetical protein